MQPRQASHSKDVQSTGVKRKFAGKARLPGKKSKNQQTDQNNTSGLNIEEIVSSVSQIILPELTKTIHTIISQREDTGAVSNSRNQQPAETSTTASRESWASPNMEQNIETINPNQPNTCEGTSFVCLNDSSNLDLVENAIVSINDELGMHVPLSTRQKIMKGEFIELYSLLDRHQVNEQENKIIFNNGQLSFKPVNQNKIFDILTWLDAFFIYMSIYLVAHPDQAHKMLKYMANVKTAASRSNGFGWREYDRQFRIKKARNDCIPWNQIDQELWLLYINSTASASKQQAPPKNACFDFNNKGVCMRQYCQYSHSCLKCSGKHPATKCQYQNNKAGVQPNTEKPASQFFRGSWKKPQTSSYQKTRINTY
jgi:hypothetical protein